ncbi:YceI family protein [Paenibacillus rigui]|uniref:Lipid/polyisoprenoid-binding YceI-like domain-containing protein n=1 Tax=Paenibacillus rigui TaxID=554312 RepID=A0A229UWH8_9BACL|nr:YceI family protein [Paenibacillus rigui]OXM87269.1 hypothetical protein CF651_06415 [Paenibacillus rigui]
MKPRTVFIAAGIGILVLAGGGYGAYDYFAGNHVEVKDVIAKEAVAAPSGNQPVEAKQVAGTWVIQPESKVYFSVTTSKETVNIEGGAVQGNWIIDLANPSAMKAEATVDMNSLNSGNPQRDGHIKGADYLNTAGVPVSSFKVKSFDNLPKEWKEGTKFPFTMNGTLTVRGISKDVTFQVEGQYSQNTISLEGSTVVTFDQFGMKNPHTVTLDTQNDVKVQLRLVLKK